MKPKRKMTPEMLKAQQFIRKAKLLKAQGSFLKKAISSPQFPQLGLTPESVAVTSQSE